MAKKFKLKKGDDVVVVSGRDKGKTGSILRVLREDAGEDRDCNLASPEESDLVRVVLGGRTHAAGTTLQRTRAHASVLEPAGTVLQRSDAQTR